VLIGVLMILTALRLLGLTRRTANNVEVAYLLTLYQTIPLLKPLLCLSCPHCLLLCLSKFPRTCAIALLILCCSNPIYTGKQQRISEPTTANTLLKSINAPHEHTKGSSQTNQYHATPIPPKQGSGTERVAN
jgi:hypothetical protein